MPDLSSEYLKLKSAGTCTEHKRMIKNPGKIPPMWKASFSCQGPFSESAHANANMALERSNFIQVNVEAVAKGYHKCPFVVQDNELFRLEAKIGERGPAFRICSSRGQLGHLQKELVPILWPFKDTKMVW